MINSEVLIPVITVFLAILIIILSRMQNEIQTKKPLVKLSSNDVREMILVANNINKKLQPPIECYLMKRNEGWFLIPLGNSVHTIGIVPVNKLNKGEV